MTLLALLTLMAVEARIITIKMSDGSTKAFSSAQLSSVTFNNDGTMTILTYDGQTITGVDGSFEWLTVNDEPVVYESFVDTAQFDPNNYGLSSSYVFKRPIQKVNFLYPTVDPDGAPITMSSTILIPEDIWNGEVKSEGIVLSNHYTFFSKKEAPTLVNGEITSLMLANPLHLNYIAVESDLYGFGAAERYSQAYLQGSCNSQPTLDALLAAKVLLRDMGIDYGPLCFNIGYSSGGYDALQTQKVRDMKYRGRISFDKTFAGGSPSDVVECYRQYILRDSTAYNGVLLLLMVSTSDTQRLNLNYDEMFQPEISKLIEPLILSKEYNSTYVNNVIGPEKKVHELLKEPYVDLESAECKSMMKLFEKSNVAHGWVPDPSQRLYIMHAYEDDYVPVASARPIISFLKEKGFKPSIVPGKTNLQTNFFVRGLGHLLGTSVYVVQTFAALKAWPKMYIQNRLHPAYERLVNTEPDLKSLLVFLQNQGIDVRSIANKLVALVYQKVGLDLTQLTPEAARMIIEKALAERGINYNDLIADLSDFNIDPNELVAQLIELMKEIQVVSPVVQGSQRAAGVAPRVDEAKLEEVLDKETLPVMKYERQLYDLFTPTKAVEQ